MTKDYYIYALKDPRSNPSKVFYIGKGTGVRDEQHIHVARSENSEKAKRIREIEDAGHKTLAIRLVTGLEEYEAYKVEAELIAAFGVTANGGILTNAVIPSGIRTLGGSTGISIPQGALELAQIGREFLMRAIRETVQANPEGVYNFNLASQLGLRSDNGGQQTDYITYSILGLLMREGSVSKVKQGGKALYLPL